MHPFSLLRRRLANSSRLFLWSAAAGGLLTLLVFFVGVAYDYCVGWSAREAARRGFESIVVEDLTRGIDAGTIDSTNAVFVEAGVQRIQSTDVRQQ